MEDLYSADNVVLIDERSDLYGYMFLYGGQTDDNTDRHLIIGPNTGAVLTVDREMIAKYEVSMSTEDKPVMA